ncbi:MAG: hypothetical protein Q4D94_06210 [Bacillota bacterium]|nr:hypothetical protein [Bacillota bacterium]
MKQAIKVIITVAVALASCFVVLFSFGYFFYEQDNTRYEASEMAMAEILDVQLKELGKSYQGNSEEGTSYYMISVLAKNPGNSQKNDYELSFSYIDDEGYTYNKVMEMNRSNSYYNNGNGVLPAGMTGVINRVLQIDDDCKSFTLRYRSYVTEEEQEIEINL